MLSSKSSQDKWMSAMEHRKLLDCSFFLFFQNFTCERTLKIILLWHFLPKQLLVKKCKDSWQSHLAKIFCLMYPSLE